MLVFKRRTQETSVITTPEGRTITVTVLRIERGRVVLGFVAEPGVVIDRGEVAAKKLAAVVEV